MTSLRFSSAPKTFRDRPQQGSSEPICQLRGYCGPFTGQEYYEMLEVWAGFGTCQECRRTVPVPPSGAESAWKGWSSPREAA